VLSKAILRYKAKVMLLRYKAKVMLQDAIGSRSHKVRVGQLENFHFM